MDLKTILKKSLLILLALTLFYTLSMALMALIPSSLVQRNVNQSLSVLETEDTYPKYFFDSNAARLDNFTDRLMVQAAVPDQAAPFWEQSLVFHGRIQYWQGYLVYLKPLLIFFQIYQIRYLLYVLYFFLFSCSVLVMAKVAHNSVTISYVLALISSNLLFTSVSLQYISVYLILFSSIILYYVLRDKVLNDQPSLFLFFLVIGSLICFMDFLTAPLLTLGIPLAVILIQRNDTAPARWQENLSLTIGSSCFWGVGYAFTFVSKWSVSSILLRRNAFVQAINQLLFRISGDEEVLLDRSKMLEMNVSSILGYNRFSATEMIIATLLLLLLCLVLFFARPRLARFHRIPDSRDRSVYLCVALIGIYPYLWYNVFGNHSQIHYWMTYRIQAITVFSLCFILSAIVNRGFQSRHHVSGT